MAYLPTNIVAGQAGHVAHSNQAYELLNQIQSPTSGSDVINVLNPPAAVSAVGAVGDNVTDDNVAIQNCLDYVKSPRNGHWVYFPYLNRAGVVANYLTSKPLKVWNGARIKGPGTISPHPTFDWVNHPYWQDPLYKPVGNPQPGDVCLLELWNESTGRGAFSRIIIEDLKLDGKSQSGSHGLLTKLQQPCYTWKLRIDHFDVGWTLWGQQSEHYNTDLLSCKLGLLLGSITGSFDGFCKMMTFNALNIEAWTDAGIRTNTDGPNTFKNLHMEGGLNTSPAYDCRQGSFFVEQGLASHGGPVFVIGNTVPIPAPKNTYYAIKNWQMTTSDSTYTQLLLDDRVTGLTLPVGYARRPHEMSRFFQNDTQVDFDASIAYMGDEGGYIWMGGLKGGTAAPPGHSGAQMTIRANNNQDEPMVRWHGSTGVLRAGVGQSGNLFVGAYDDTTRATITTGLAVGSVIFNTGDNAPNFWNGTGWRDAMGAVT